MGIFTPDFAAVDAGFPIYERGMYRVKVTGRSPFVREKTDAEGNVKQQSGVHYTLEMYGRLNTKGKVESTDENGREIRGKAVSRFTVWLHAGEGGWSYAKPFLMAASGYNVKNEENEANAELFQSGVWTFKGDPGDSEEALSESLGSSWGIPVDRMVDVFLKKKVTERDGTTYEDQEFSAWTPVGDRAA